MAVPNFDQRGADLAKKTALKMFKEDLIVVREWLDDAASQASPGAMASWGTLISNLLEHLSDDSSSTVHSAKTDYMRLGTYLNAMQALDSSIWWTRGPRNSFGSSGGPGVHTQIVAKPVYEIYNAFYDVCKCLDAGGLERSNTLLRNLVEREAWDPTKLLVVLNTMHQQQLNEAEARRQWKAGWTVGIRDTAQGQLLRALRPLVLDTPWRPQDTTRYGDTWLVHDNILRNGDLEQAQRSKEFVQRFATSTPSQTDKLVAFMLSSSGLSAQGLADFFPLHLANCQAKETLHALVGILTDSGSQHAHDKAERIEFLLNAHHPEIMSILKMHLSIFPDADRINSMAEVLVLGFDTLRGRGPVLTMDVASDVFDDGSIGIRR